MNAGTVELSVSLSLANLVKDAQKARQEIQTKLGDLDVKVGIAIDTGDVAKAGQDAGDNFARAFNNALDGVFQGFGQKIAQISLEALQGAVQAFIGLGQAGLQASDKLQAGIAAANSLGADGKAVSDALGQLSNDLGGLASQNDLVAASYDVLSARTATLTNGLSDAQVATEILSAATKGAKGGFSDVATVSDALTSVLNAYGLSASEAENVTAKLSATQNAGKITIGQYASQIGRLAPIASQAGVSLDDLNGFIAVATSQGVPVESTFAGIRQAISAVLKPTDQASELAKELGIEFNAAALKTGGLSGVLGQLSARGLDTQENLFKLFGSVEAVTAIAPASGRNFGILAENIQRSANALKNGELDTALNAVASTAESNFANSINLAKNSLIKLGDAIAPARNSFLSLAAGIISAVTDAEKGTTAFDVIGDASERFAEALKNNPELLDAIKQAAVQLANTLGEVSAAVLDALASFAGSDEAAQSFTILAEQIDLAGNLITTLVQGVQIAGAIFDAAFGPVIDLFVLLLQTMGKVRDLIGEIGGKLGNLGDVIRKIPGIGRLLPGGDEEPIPTTDEAFKQRQAFAAADRASAAKTTKPATGGSGGGTPPKEEEKQGRNFDRELADLENEGKLRRAALLASGASEQQIREAQFQAEQQLLDRRIALNVEKEAELREAIAREADPKEKAKLEKELLGVESAIAGDRLKVQENLAQNRERVEKEALDRIEEANKRANRAIEQSQQQRTIAIRRQQQEGVLSAEEAEREIEAIQDNASAALIAQKQRELAQVRSLRAQGTLDAEEASDREAQLQGEIGQITLDRIQSQIAAQERAAEEERKRAQELLQLEAARAQGGIDAETRALSQRNNLLNAQANLQQAIAGFQNQQLQTAIEVAETSGRSAEAARLRLQLQQQQEQQLLAQQAIEDRQLKLAQERERIELRREELLNRIKQKEIELQIIQARQTGASVEAIANLEEQLRLQQEIASEFTGRRAALSQEQEIERTAQQVNQFTAQEGLRQNQIGELQSLGQQGGFSRELTQRLDQLRNPSPVALQGSELLRSLQAPAALAPQLATPSVRPADVRSLPPIQIEGLDDTFNKGVDRILNRISEMEIATTYNLTGIQDAEAAAQAVERKRQQARMRLQGR